MYFRRTLTFPAPTLIMSPPGGDLEKIKTATTAETATSTNSRNRFVSFNTALNVVHQAKWSKKSTKSRWYNKKEIKQFKDDFFSTCRERRESKSHAEVAYQKVMLVVYDECCVAKSDDTALSTLGEYSLRTFISKSSNRWGMERNAVREIEYDKRHRRVDLLEAVFKAHTAYHAGSPEARTALVRRASEHVSRPARLFARHIADALENSLQPEI